MAVPPIPTRHLIALLGGHGLTEKETPVEYLAHPLANIAFEIAGLVGLGALVATARPARRAIWRALRGRGGR